MRFVFGSFLEFYEIKSGMCVGDDDNMTEMEHKTRTKESQN